METIELKFLLKLLGFPDYQAPLSKISPNSKTSALERERICRKLCDRKLIACSSDIIQFKISLFLLEENGRIELTSITRAWRYSEQELNAGIPQRAGSRLFFVSMK